MDNNLRTTNLLRMAVELKAAQEKQGHEAVINLAIGMRLTLASLILEAADERDKMKGEERNGTRR